MGENPHMNNLIGCLNKKVDKIRFFFDPNAYDKDGNLIDGNLLIATI